MQCRVDLAVAALVEPLAAARTAAAESPDTPDVRDAHALLAQLALTPL